MSSTYNSDTDIDWTGTVMNNRYALLNKLGDGSYASVWCVYDLIDKKYKALKISNRHDYKTAKKESHLYKTISNFKNNYLMTCSDSFDYISDEKSNISSDDDSDSTNEESFHHCIIIDLMGCSLYECIKYKKELSYEQILLCVHNVLLGLTELHKNKIIHGDVKPENILISGISPKHKTLYDKIDFIKLLKNKNKNDIKKKHFQNLISNEIKKYFHAKEYNISDSSDTSDSTSDDGFLSDVESVISLPNSCFTDTSSNVSHHDIIHDDDLINMHTKITDFGTSLIEGSGDRKKKEIQTCYYQSPEILLGVGYDCSCDMWALGCTFYELLLRRIMFDCYSYEGNRERYHLYCMEQKLGKIPDYIISTSLKKDIYYTSNFKRVKGFKKNNKSMNINNDFETIKQIYGLDNNSYSYLVDFLNKIFTFDNKKRLTVNEALNHKIFKK